MAGMYCMKDLLGLLQREGAEELLLVPGAPPAIMARGKPRTVDTPTLTPDELRVLLESISSNGQREELEKCGDVRFIYVRNSLRFAVMATHLSGTLNVTIKNLGR